MFNDRRNLEVAFWISLFSLVASTSGCGYKSQIHTVNVNDPKPLERRVEGTAKDKLRAFLEANMPKEQHAYMADCWGIGEKNGERYQLWSVKADKCVNYNIEIPYDWFPEVEELQRDGTVIFFNPEEAGIKVDECRGLGSNHVSLNNNVAVEVYKNEFGGPEEMHPQESQQEPGK
ncbi:MAG: hypothetical protein KJ709_06790 [Nanoarchaeota archaeon]|nr:hypothetical protein [Nanoarchaeota archaeon]